MSFKTLPNFPHEYLEVVSGMEKGHLYKIHSIWTKLQLERQLQPAKPAQIKQYANHQINRRWHVFL